MVFKYARSGDATTSCSSERSRLARWLRDLRVVAAVLRGTGLPTRPVFELGELLRYLLEKLSRARCRCDSSAPRPRRRRPRRCAGTAPSRLRARRSRCDARGSLRSPRAAAFAEAADELPQQAHDLLRHGARRGNDDDGTSGGALLDASAVSAFSARMRPVMLESRLSAVGPCGARPSRDRSPHRARSSDPSRPRKLAGGRTQRGLELGPRALFILELLNELAVLVLPLLFRRYLGHRRSARRSRRFIGSRATKLKGPETRRESRKLACACGGDPGRVVASHSAGNRILRRTADHDDSSHVTARSPRSRSGPRSRRQSDPA